MTCIQKMTPSVTDAKSFDVENRYSIQQYSASDIIHVKDSIRGELTYSEQVCQQHNCGFAKEAAKLDPMSILLEQNTYGCFLALSQDLP